MVINDANIRIVFTDSIMLLLADDTLSPVLEITSQEIVDLTKELV